MPKRPPRPPGSTPGEAYLSALYTKITLRLPKSFAKLLKNEAEDQGRGVTAVIVEALCRQYGWPVPRDQRKSDL